MAAPDTPPRRVRGADAGGALRWSRAALLAALALGTGVVAHVSAQGRMPGPTTLVVLYAVTAALCAALLGRPAGTLRIVVLLVAGQTFVHGALTALSGHRGDPPLQRAAPAPVVPVVPVVPSGTGRRGSYYELTYGAAHPGGAATPLVLPAPVQHVLADLTGPHAAMALAHLGAAVLVGAWLAVGERALWGLLALLIDGVRAVDRAGTGALVVLAAHAAPRRTTCGGRPDAHRDLPAPLRVLAPALCRRGPPVPLAG